jgi:hypothetical protein
MEPERFRYCQHTPKWYQNEQRLFCNKYIHSIWIGDLSSRKGVSSETTYGSSRQLLSSYKSDLNRLARRTWHAPHTTPTLFIRSGPVTSTCFPWWKKNSNRFRSLTRTDFLSPCKSDWGVSIKTNWMAYFKLAFGGFKKWSDAIETTPDDKCFSSPLVLFNFIRRGRHMYFPPSLSFPSVIHFWRNQKGQIV